MTTPLVPTAIPNSTIKPSFPSNPKEMIKIPSPGMKLESGIGKRMKKEKMNAKMPIILSAIGEIMKSRRGLRIFSTLPM